MFADRFLRWNSGVAGATRGNRRSVLWPVHVWSVMAPDRSPSELNVFQEAILGLLHTGLRDLDELARCLDLDRDLAAFIIATQLQPSGWIDARQQVTPLGVQVLSGLTSDEPSLAVQYAFQDAITGRWLPRLARDLPELEPLPETVGTSPEFVIDRDSGRRIRPFLLAPQTRAGEPDKAGAKQALRHFQRDLRRGRLEEDAYIHDAVSDDFDFVDGAPTAAYVWCDVFVSPSDLQPWLVSDPWRVTEAAAWLREPLLERLGQFPGLAKRIAEVIPDGPPSEASVGDWLGQLELRVDLELADLPHLESQPLIREHLARVLRQLRRIEGQNRVHQEELASLAQESMSAFEAILKWILEKWPVDANGWPEGKWSRKDLASLLQGLPVKAPLSPTVIEALCGQDARQVRLAVLRRDRPLKALLTGALLSTYARTDHPLMDLPARTLQWDRLMAFVAMRNEGSHASGQKLDPSSVLEMARFAVEWHGQFKPHY